MAETTREELKAKRAELAELKRANAEKQRELAKEDDAKELEKYSKSLDVDLAYEKWAGDVLNGGSGEPPEIEPIEEPPNNVEQSEVAPGPEQPDRDGEDD